MTLGGVLPPPMLAPLAWALNRKSGGLVGVWAAAVMAILRWPWPVVLVVREKREACVVLVHFSGSGSSLIVSAVAAAVLLADLIAG